MRLPAGLVLFALAPASGGPLGPTDRAWIESCIEQRATSDLRGATARRYCSCMLEIVDPNEPFSAITALERAYPPADRMCLAKAGQRGN